MIDAVHDQQGTCHIHGQGGGRAKTCRRRGTAIPCKGRSARPGERGDDTRTHGTNARIACVRDIQRSIRAEGEALRTVEFRTHRRSAIARKALYTIARNHQQRARQRGFEYLMTTRIGDEQIANGVRNHLRGQQQRRNRWRLGAGISADPPQHQKGKQPIAVPMAMCGAAEPAFCAQTESPSGCVSANRRAADSCPSYPLCKPFLQRMGYRERVMHSHIRGGSHSLVRPNGVAFGQANSLP